MTAGFTSRYSQPKISFRIFRQRAQIVIGPGARRTFLLVLSLSALVFAAACRSDSDGQRVRPRQLRDVPAQKLAFKLDADVDAPPGINDETRPNPAIQQDFDERRKDEALVLLRTVASPDGQRALSSRTRYWPSLSRMRSVPQI